MFFCETCYFYPQHGSSLILYLFNDVSVYFKELAPELDQGQPAQDMADITAESGTLQEGKSTEKGKDKEEKEKVKDLDALLQRLPGCVSRDLIDQLTVITLLPSFFFLLGVFSPELMLYVFSAIHLYLKDLIAPCFFSEYSVSGRVLLFKFKVKSEKAC